MIAEYKTVLSQIKLFKFHLESKFDLMSPDNGP